MNILIMGVTGFIGERLVKRLVSRHSVIGMSRGSFNDDAMFVRGSFDRFEYAEVFISGYRKADFGWIGQV